MRMRTGIAMATAAIARAANHVSARRVSKILAPALRPLTCGRRKILRRSRPLALYGGPRLNWDARSPNHIELPSFAQLAANASSGPKHPGWPEPAALAAERQQLVGAARRGAPESGRSPWKTLEHREHREHRESTQSTVSTSALKKT
jgi:hypothetical protein